MPETPGRLVALSPLALGRVIAALFLTTIVLGIIAEMFISERLISLGDPARTARAITANLSLYRTGFTLYMIELAVQIAGTVLLYFLLKPVNGRVATLALAFGLVGCTIKIMSRVFYLAPMFLLDRNNALGSADLMSELSLTLLNVNARGAGVALAFFGIETVLEGWLMIRSTFLPRWLGGLFVVGGIGWLSFLSPTFGYGIYNIVAPVGLLGIVAFIGWLLFKGVDEQRWLAMDGRAAITSRH